MPTLTRVHLEHNRLRWLFVYTLEAHAVDEWPISSSRYNPSGQVVSISQHKTLEERIRAAKKFRKASRCHCCHFPWLWMASIMLLRRSSALGHFGSTS
mmetsp:Transcript_139231/g.445026  ORF Transcript_139231/g.445026 Transcript_139231/m.445026 type:complete len:98 (+) Transcript_139231:1671-1964(+)